MVQLDDDDLELAAAPRFTHGIDPEGGYERPCRCEDWDGQPSESDTGEEAVGILSPSGTM